ncbi:MAG: glycosyltransferase family 1 protein [bacterium]|nr:glycosyltransferase family 1 protein [bacterium]
MRAAGQGKTPENNQGNNLDTNQENQTVCVGVNLLWLRPGRVGGSEDYAVRLLTSFPTDASDVPLRCTLFATKRFVKTYPSLQKRFEVVPAPFCGSRVLRVFVENTWLAAQCRRRGLNAIHHLGGTVPLIGIHPAVVTVHDLQPLDYPKRFGFIKRRYLRAMLPWAVRRAEAVVTVSEFCRDRISARLGIAADKIAVIPAPVCLPVEQPEAHQSPEMPQLTVQPDLSQPFLLYPAVTYPHKNHEVLLRALAMLTQQGKDVALVATGATGPLDDDLDRLATELGVGERWHRLGRVSRQVVDGLYRQALGLVFASRYEGYGLPVAEAMARGCPVLATDTEAIAEVLGNGGRLLDPDDPHVWAEAISDLLTQPTMRQELIAAGICRAQELAALDPAADLCAVYLAVAQPKPPSGPSYT